MIEEADVFEGFNVPPPPPVEMDRSYEATLQGLKTKRGVRDDGEPWTMVVWTFEVKGTNDEKCDLDATSSDSLHPMSKAFGWLMALAGKQIATEAPSMKPGDLAHVLIGLDCIVTIGPDKQGFPKVVGVSAPLKR